MLAEAMADRTMLLHSRRRVRWWKEGGESGDGAESTTCGEQEPARGAAANGAPAARPAGMTRPARITVGDAERP